MKSRLRKTTLVGVTALMLCVAPGVEASAQRTMRGENLITVEGSYPFTGPYGWGADLTYGQYLLSSYWKAGASVSTYSATFTDGQPLPYLHACAHGGWMYRLVGTRNRVFNLYGGAGAFLGYEAVDPKGLVPEEYKGEDFSSGRFLYGVQVSLEMEIFFSRRVALILGARAPMNFSSPYGWFHYQVGGGLRLNI